VVVCLERGADLHTAQLMPLPLTVSCLSKIQIGFTFLVPAHPGSPGRRAVKQVCVCVMCVCVCVCVVPAVLLRVGAGLRLSAAVRARPARAHHVEPGVLQRVERLLDERLQTLLLLLLLGKTTLPEQGCSGAGTRRGDGVPHFFRQGTRPPLPPIFLD